MQQILRLQLFNVLCLCLLERSMEETVRTLLQNQDPLEGAKVDPLDLMKAYKVQRRAPIELFHQRWLSPSPEPPFCLSVSGQTP